MSIKSRVNDGILIVQVNKEINIQTSQDLRKSLQKLVSAEQNRVIVDLKNCDFIDSSGIGGLLSVQNLLKNIDGRLVLCSLQPRAMRVIQLTDLEEILEITSDVEQARQRMLG